MSGKYTILPSPELDALLDSVREGIARELDAVPHPGLACVILGGGYGRGEGGVLHTETGDRLYNDLDFFVFSENAGRRARKKLSRELRGIAERWEKQLGIAVDFSPVKNLEALSGSADTLMLQELLHGWKPVWGKTDWTRRLPEREPDQLPFTEAARLLMNRGMGLIFAGERLAAGKDGKEEADFIVRNMNKAVLGCGDALLLTAGKYVWRGEDRVRAFSGLAEQNGIPPSAVRAYAEAFHYKLEPVPVLPPDPRKRWTECRELFLDSVRRAAGTDPSAGPREVTERLRQRAADARSLKHFLRWLIRTGHIRKGGGGMDDPVVNVLGMVFSCLAEGGACPPCPAELYRLWCKFN